MSNTGDSYLQQKKAFEAARQIYYLISDENVRGVSSKIKPWRTVLGAPDNIATLF